MASGARTSTRPTYLECPHCGTIAPIHRKVGRLKDKGHIKDLWCWKCKDTTKHIEVKEDPFIPSWIGEFQAQFILEEEQE